MPPVPKPVSKPKKEKKYSSFNQKKPIGSKVKKQKVGIKKESALKELKKQTLPQHNHRPTRKDRAEFPPIVVKELKEEADERCMCGCGRNDNETHHVMPRTRSGRGVKTNGMRVNTICNRRFHDNEDELQHWIEVYRKKYGEYFWYDEQDWLEHQQKEKRQRLLEKKENDLIESYKPITSMIETVLGREPTSAESYLLRKIANNKNDIKMLIDLIEELQAS